MSNAPTPPEWKPLKASGLMEAIGPLQAKRKGDRWVYGLATDSRHANVIGAIHGGTLCALADQVMSLIAWEAAERQPVVTIHMDTTFIASAAPGDFLEAEARLTARKGSMLFVETIVTKAGDEVVRASCIMKAIKPRQREERHER